MNGMIGQQFGQWTIVGEVPNARYRRTICVCRCGTKKEVLYRHLKIGRSKSCGCQKGSYISAARTKEFGKTTRPFEHGCWRAMVRRCNNPGDVEFDRYGGSGIKVCEQWMGHDGFEQFLKDMGPRPSRLHTIERIDGNLGYSPENCVWATYAQQNRNRSSNAFHTLNGETQPLIVWCERFHVHHHLVRNRLRLGWDLHKALTHPVDTSKRGRWA